MPLFQATLPFSFPVDDDGLDTIGSALLELGRPFKELELIGRLGLDEAAAQAWMAQARQQTDAVLVQVPSSGDLDPDALEEGDGSDTVWWLGHADGDPAERSEPERRILDALETRRWADHRTLLEALEIDVEEGEDLLEDLAADDWLLLDDGLGTERYVLVPPLWEDPRFVASPTPQTAALRAVLHGDMVVAGWAELAEDRDALCCFLGAAWLHHVRTAVVETTVLDLQIERVSGGAWTDMFSVSRAIEEGRLPAPAPWCATLV